MQIVRRLYLYGMSGITLGVLLVGLNNLFVVVFHAFGLGRGELIGGNAGDREQLSLAIALTLVGLLVWTVHWLFVERSVRIDAAGSEGERGSAIRALYVSLVLAVLLLFGVLAGIQLLEAVARALLGVSNSPDFGFLGNDAGAALATVLVVGLAWLYHAAIRRRDLATAPMEGAAAWIPRIYLYGATFVGLVLAALNIGTLLSTALDVAVGTGPDFVDPDFIRRGTADALAGIAGWGVVFVGHWWYATTLMRGEGWRASSEQRSRVRVAYLFAVIVAGAIATVVFVAQAVSAILRLQFGVQDEFSSTTLQMVLGPLLSLLPWAFAWLLHRRWLEDEANMLADPARSLAVSRLASAGVALIGLLAAAGGIGGLLGLLLDIVLGGNRTSEQLWRREVDEFLAVAFIGCVLWLWNWASLQARRSRDPEGEAHSTIRRAYLLSVVGASLLAGLASLIVLLYQLFNAILGVDPFVNRASEISASLGALLTAIGLAVYHGRAERRDHALRESTVVPETPATAAETSTQTGPIEATVQVVERRLVLRGASADEVEAALRQLRSNLPANIVLEED